MASRRDVVKGIGAVALAGVAAPSVVRGQELTKISMGFGIKSINPIIINILIGSGLGKESLSHSMTMIGLAMFGLGTVTTIVWHFKKKLSGGKKRVVSTPNVQHPTPKNE